jgi:NADPH:quinone reductase-like Zn-dependent oxidoreductase
MPVVLQGEERIIRAIEVHQNGGPEVLKLHCLEIGKPGPGQALVRLVAARGTCSKVAG